MGKRKRNYPEWMNEEQAIGILHSLICLYNDEHDKVKNQPPDLTAGEFNRGE